MNLKEALQAVIQDTVSDNLLEKALLDYELTSTDTYDADKSAGVDLAAIDVIQGLLSAPNVSEGGYSVTRNYAALNAKLLFLARKHGVLDVLEQQAPSVKGVRRW